MVLFHTTRTDYSAKEAGKYTLTIGELIKELNMFDEDEKIVFCNDNGYTYGKIDENLLVDIDDDFAEPNINNSEKYSMWTDENGVN